VRAARAARAAPAGGVGAYAESDCENVARGGREGKEQQREQRDAPRSGAAIVRSSTARRERAEQRGLKRRALVAVHDELAAGERLAARLGRLKPARARASEVLGSGCAGRFVRGARGFVRGARCFGREKKPELQRGGKVVRDVPRVVSARAALRDERGERRLRGGRHSRERHHEPPPVEPPAPLLPENARSAAAGQRRRGGARAAPGSACRRVLGAALSGEARPPEPPPPLPSY